MPWRDKSVEELRKEFVEAAATTSNFSSLCREFNITRKTGYKWLNRYQYADDLSDMSRKPHKIANKTPLDMELMIVKLRVSNPGWGPKKLRQVLLDHGIENLPCIKTIGNILNRYSMISPEESAKHTPYIRFEKDNCNDMWQMDFKGEFKTKDGKWCFPLNILDDHSRFLIKTSPFVSTANVVIPTLKSAFEEYGLPYSILCDNGGQFAGFGGGYTQFEKWLMNLDVLPKHGKPRHPQTQGKIERFHRTMKKEFLNIHSYDDVSDVNINLQQWRNKYNTVRPHEALGMKTPSAVYHPSKRDYSKTIKSIEYSGEYMVLKVNYKGYIRYDGWHFYLSETMAGEYIELRFDYENEIINICYRNYQIAQYSITDGTRINRSIYRLYDI